MPISQRPGKDIRLKRLLEAGFFPHELPPPFVSADLARLRKYLLKSWPDVQLKKFASEPEFYSVPRFGRARRRLSIINPINHFKVAKLMADEWSTIRQFLRKSRISEFKPIFDLEGSRTFFGIDFSLIERRLVEILSSYRSCLKTDISRYYHTIYTHSIPWALYGKAYCKSNHHSTTFKKKLGDRLDVVVRQCQQNQTIGIPVGPETSRVIGEIIGVGIEGFLAQSLADFDNRSLRYVDDINVGFDERDSVELILSAITRAFAHFELDINIEKTSVLGVGEVLAPEWLSPLRSFRVSPKASRQQDDLEHYFKSALYYADNNPRDHVLVYAIKRSRSFHLKDSVWPYYVNFLVRTCRKDPTCIPIAAQVIIEANHKGRPLNTNLLKKFVLDIIRIYGETHSYFEVSWALFICKALRLKLKKSDLKFVYSAESSVCALLVLDLNNRGLIDGGIDTHFWLSFYNPGGLQSSMWLLVYESTLKGWLPKHNPCFVAGHPLFGPMLSKKIQFYDQRKNVQTTRNELTLKSIHDAIARRIFLNVDMYF